MRAGWWRSSGLIPLLLIACMGDGSRDRPLASEGGGVLGVTPQGNGGGGQPASPGQGAASQCVGLAVQSAGPAAPLCCDSPFATNEPGCARIFEDPFNCGGCGVLCPDGGSCTQGVCVANECAALEPCPDADRSVCCPDAFGIGAAACTDIFADPFNCGGCGIVCEQDTQCQVGFCGPIDPLRRRVR